MLLVLWLQPIFMLDVVRSKICACGSPDGYFTLTVPHTGSFSPYSVRLRVAI